MSEQQSPAPVAQPNGLAITALVTGLAGLVLEIIFFASGVGATPLFLGLVLGIVGLIFGIIALKRGQSKGMAVTGLVAGIIAIVAALAILIFAMLFIGAFLSVGLG